MKQARQKKKRPAVSRTRRRPSIQVSALESVGWIRSLAAPYLKDYRPVLVNGGRLKGCWFLIADSSVPRRKLSRQTRSPGRVQRQSAGFFVGYLFGGAEYSFLHPEPPECFVFAWIDPVGGSLHQRLTLERDSLLRGTFEYIRWLTHRPPRFVFHERELPVMARHWPMGDWPAEKREHMARNFFIETLAWLVRSGLVRKLKEEAARG